MLSGNMAKVGKAVSACRSFGVFLCFVIAVSVSASESDYTSPQINCSHAVDAEAGSPVSLPCNVSCVSTNRPITQWYYYHEQHRTANATRTVVHNGHGGPVNPLWSARGVNVSQNNKVSVLTIAEVTTDLTGVYECAPNTNVSGGCNVRFCLTTGKKNIRLDESTASPWYIYPYEFPPPEFVLYGVCGGCLVVTLALAVIAMCYIRRSKANSRLMTSETNTRTNRYSPDLLSLRNLADERPRNDSAASSVTSEERAGPNHNVATDAVHSEVTPSCQSMNVQGTAAASATGATAGHEEPQYAEVVATKKSDSGPNSTPKFRRQDPPIYADIVHRNTTDNPSPIRKHLKRKQRDKNRSN